MALTLLLALQAAGQPLSSDAGTAGFDLARMPPPAPDACRGQNPSDIVVCGRRQAGDGYRLKEMPRTYEENPLRAETSIGGGAKARAFVDSVAMPDGQISKRIMFGIKVPF